MLVFKCRVGEKFRVGDEIIVTILDIENNQARIEIHAPREIPIYREKTFHQIQRKKQQAESRDNTDSAEVQLRRADSVILLCGHRDAFMIGDQVKVFVGKIKANGVLINVYAPRNIR